MAEEDKPEIIKKPPSKDKPVDIYPDPPKIEGESKYQLAYLENAKPKSVTNQKSLVLAGIALIILLTLLAMLFLK